MGDPLTNDQILDHLHDDLQTFAAANKGRTSIAKDPWHALELLAESPAGFRLILHWMGEDPLGGRTDLPMVSHNIEVYVSYNLGLRVDPGDALKTASALSGRPSLLRLVNDVRQRVLSLSWPDGDQETDGQCGYNGAEPVVLPNGVPLAAYKLKFTLDAVIPDFTMRT